MNILLTGGNGFMGSALVARNALNAQFFCVGRTAPPGAAGHASVNLAEGGALERAIAAGALPERIDVVIHLAVSRLHRGFPETAPDMFQVNVAATSALLDYARRAGAKQFVLGSTGTVYHPFPRALHREEDTTTPGSYFGWSKLAAEDMARLYAPKYFKLFVPRFFVPYGPGQSDRMVDGVIANVLNGRPVTIPLEGKGLTSSTIYLDDALAVLEQAVREQWEGTYNVAGDEALALEDMAAIIGRIVGKTPVVERTASASGAKLLPDVSKLKQKVDVSRFVRFEEGVARAIRARG